MTPLFEAPAAAAPARDRVRWTDKVVYGAGALVQYSGGQLIKVLSASMFVAGMGMSPAYVGWVFMAFRLWDACLDPLMGWISDNTRSRWGRRRPYVLIGGVLTGCLFPLFWVARPEWSETLKVGWLIGTGLVFYAAYTVWLMPYQSMLPEMSPDTDERTSVSAYFSLFGQIAAVLGTWIWTLTQLPVFGGSGGGEAASLHGMRVLGVVLGVVMIVLAVLPAFVVRERDIAAVVRQPKESFGRTFASAFANVPFRTLAVFVLVFTFGINLVQGQIFYLRTYYCFQGDTVAAARYGGIEGTASLVLGLLSIPLFQWLCRRVGKRETLALSTGLILLATWVSWFAYTPRYPWVSVTIGALLSPGYTGLWLVLPSMIADVIDFEELRSGRRSEGSFGAIFAWTNKLSTSLAYGLAGNVLVLCGFAIAKKADQAEGVFWNMRLCFALVPTVILVPAVGLLLRYPLSHARMIEVRGALEQRRGPG